MEISQFEQLFFNKLHEKVGICGHCGRKTCLGRKKHSILPRTVSSQDILTVFREAKEEITGTE